MKNAHKISKKSKKSEATSEPVDVKVPEVKKSASQNILQERLKNFAHLKSEYSLPNEDLNSKIILEHMSEVLEGYIKIVIQLIQPEEFYSLHECNVFDDTEKSRMFELYKNLMVMHRELLKSDIQNDEDNNIATIDIVDAQLMLLKPQIIKIVQKMQSSWKGPSATSGAIRYFG